MLFAFPNLLTVKYILENYTKIMAGVMMVVVFFSKSSQSELGQVPSGLLCRKKPRQEDHGLDPKWEV